MLSRCKSCIYHRDTCFDAHLFQRLFCLYHVMLCTRFDDVTACFLFYNNMVLHCQEKQMESKRLKGKN